MPWPINPRPDWLEPSAPPALRELAATLGARLIGQPEAIAQIVRAVTRFRAGLAGRERPVAAFLFIGPTGVGKTLAVEALAEALHGSPQAMLKIHCAEVRAEHELARMKGPPPGYVGWHEMVPLFHQKRLEDARHLKDEALALVLFDEVEKAHPALWDLLLGILDKGEVVLNDATSSDFRKALIFMTGNVGAREVAEALSGGMGFQPHAYGGAEGYATRAAEQLFSPEFRNRLTAVVSFRALGPEQLREVAKRELARLAHILSGTATPGCAAPGFTLLHETPIVDRIVAEGYEPRYGARHIRRAIERLLEDPLANLLASGQIVAGDRLVVSSTATPGCALRFRKDADL